MERKVVKVCRIVGVLGILSAALGFVAEALRITDAWFVPTSSNHCSHPPTLTPFLLGITAVLLLLISQIFLNVSAGCICCMKGPRPRFPDSNWGVALSFILSWFTFIMAVTNFLKGALVGNYTCNGRTVGVFAGGAIICLANTAFGIVYYLTLTAAGKNKNPNANPNPNPEGIAMGQAQIPEINQDPLFVHEDTYNRRQFP